MFCLSWSARATRNTSHDSWPHFHTHVVSFQKSPFQICRVSRRIWRLLFAPVSRPCWNRNCEGSRGDKHSLRNSHCSHNDATRHTEWRRSLLPRTAHAFTYCHWLAFYGTSLETFWYTYVSSSLIRSFKQRSLKCKSALSLAHKFRVFENSLLWKGSERSSEKILRGDS